MLSCHLIINFKFIKLDNQTTKVKTGIKELNSLVKDQGTIPEMLFRVIDSVTGVWRMSQRNKICLGLRLRVFIEFPASTGRWEDYCEQQIIEQ